MILKALSTINHDGVVYEADYTLEVTEKQAKQLLEAGVAVEASARDIKVAEALRAADLEEAKATQPKGEASKTANVQNTDGEGDKEDGQDDANQPDGEPSLEWTREQLERYAEEHGVADARNLPNKRKLFEAIQAAGGNDQSGN